MLIFQKINDQRSKIEVILAMEFFFKPVKLELVLLGNEETIQKYQDSSMEGRIK